MYSTFIAYVLWFFGGLGTLGFHRFYLGKIGTGVLYFVTGGLAAVGSIYDFFTLPMQVREANLTAKYRRALESDQPRQDGREELRRDFRREIGRTRETSGDSIERVILRTAKKHDGIATPAEVALEGNISLDDAKKHLEQLVSRGYADMRVTKSGSIVYLFSDFITDDVETQLEDF
ncbi:MAG: TM2 domain-containing protein [Spirochaetales bacterium]|nr:TM2 domain-containing protein [Spirochaetales bacterium]